MNRGAKELELFGDTPSLFFSGVCYDQEIRAPDFEPLFRLVCRKGGERQ
jgi:hypothetical protein